MPGQAVEAARQWILNRQAIPDHVLAALLETLFSRTTSLVTGALVAWSVAIVAFERTGELWALAWLCFDIATVLARVAIVRVHQRRDRSEALRSVECRAFAMMLLGSMWAAALGGGAFLCIWSQDPVLILLSSVIVTGVIGAIAFRNAAIPRYAMFQMALCEIAICVGVLTLPMSWVWLIALKTPFYTLGMSNIARDHARMMINTILNEHEAKAVAARLDAALVNMPVGLLLFEADAGLQVWNDRAAEVFGINPAIFARGMSLMSVLQTAAIMPDVDAVLNLETIVHRLKSDFGEVQAVLPDGRSLLLMGRKGDGGLISVMVKDITRRRQEEAHIAHLARHDALTGLANRNQFNDRLAACYGAAQDTPFALLFIDLDGFKAVNDTYGHQVGDQLLCAVAERLSRQVPPGSTVARLGGDEFAIILSLNPVGALLLAEHLIEVIARPYEFGPDRTAIVGASIGLAQGAKDAASAEMLQSQADRALYAAKGAGKGIVRAFEPTMDRREMDPDVARLRPVAGSKQ